MTARPASTPDPRAFIALVDRFAVAFGVPTYSEIAAALPKQVAALEASERRAADLYAGLRAVTEHAAAAQVLLLHTGLDQPHATVERVLDEALERVATANVTGNDALIAAETRPDVAGRPEVAVLAAHRDRLRAAGRCA